MKPYIYAYSVASESASLLAKALDTVVIRHVRSVFRPAVDKLIINWGASDIPERVWRGCAGILNTPQSKKIATNKLSAFKAMQAAGVSIPDWTEDRQAVIDNNWKKIVCRAELHGKEGEGMTVVERKDINILPQVPLYVKYIPKDKEFRIHVFRGRVIDKTRKVLRANHEGPVNWQIRNTANGFVFQRNGIDVPVSVEEEAIKAVSSMGLDFGAVDVIWNDKAQRAYVLEVNTAPGIEGTTVDRYADAIKEYCQ